MVCVCGSVGNSEKNLCPQPSFPPWAHTLPLHTGWFSQQGHGFDRPGISFNLDPVYSNPTDPVWKEYLQVSERGMGPFSPFV